jgi:hypothetical protein
VWYPGPSWRRSLRYGLRITGPPGPRSAICTGMHSAPKIICTKGLTYTEKRVYSQMVRGFPIKPGPIRGFTVGSVAVLPRSR